MFCLAKSDRFREASLTLSRIMDGVSAVASVTAVVELSAKISLLCVRYVIAVNNAKKDIECLQRKVADLQAVLGGMKSLLDGVDKTRLSVADTLANSLKNCILQLGELETRLDPGESRNVMSRLGKRLKWPYTSKEVEQIVVGLDTYERSFILALQVDQT